MPVDGSDNRKATNSSPAKPTPGSGLRVAPAIASSSHPALIAAEAVLAASARAESGGQAAADLNRSRLAERIVALNPRPLPLQPASPAPIALAATRARPATVATRGDVVPLDELARELARTEQRLSERGAIASPRVALPVDNSVAAMIASMPKLASSSPLRALAAPQESPPPASGGYGAPARRALEALPVKAILPRQHPLEHAPGFLFGLMMSAAIGVGLYVMLVS